MTLLHYSSTAQPTTLSGSVSSTAGTISVGAVAGFPSDYPYKLLLDWGSFASGATQEVVLVTAGSSTSLTVTRGYDGTSASGHASGAVVVHGVSAGDFSLGPSDWINAVVAEGADPTGNADSTTAIQDAITAAGTGVCYLPAGTYTTSAVLNPVSGGRICGPMYGAAKIVNTTTAIFDTGPSSLLDNTEIDHLTLEATAGNIFDGANMARCHIHDCNLIQNGTGYGILGGTITELNECSFDRNRETAAVASRTVPMWNIVNSGTNVNNNRWTDTRGFNSGPDLSQFWWYLAGTGGTGLTNNQFVNCEVEAPAGGLIRVESCSGTVIDSCFAWDLAANTWGNSLISIGENATAGFGSSNTVIRNCGRNGGSSTGGNYDVLLESTTSDTLVENQFLKQQAGGSALTLDAGSSSGAVFIGCAVVPSNLASDTVIVAAGRVLGLAATTGAAGYTLINGTGTILSWTAPADGLLHRVLLMSIEHVTSACTGGNISTSFTMPDGSTASGNFLIGGTQGVGAHPVTQSYMIESGSTFTVQQSAALTAGAAMYWVELWAS